MIVSTTEKFLFQFEIVCAFVFTETHRKLRVNFDCATDLIVYLLSVLHVTASLLVIISVILNYMFYIC